jgi:hypothetical protein
MSPPRRYCALFGLLALVALSAPRTAATAQTLGKAGIGPEIGLKSIAA